MFNINSGATRPPSPPEPAEHDYVPAPYAHTPYVPPRFQTMEEEDEDCLQMEAAAPPPARARVKHAPARRRGDSASS